MRELNTGPWYSGSDGGVLATLPVDAGVVEEEDVVVRVGRGLGGLAVGSRRTGEAVLAMFSVVAGEEDEDDVFRRGPCFAVPAP